MGPKSFGRILFGRYCIFVWCVRFMLVPWRYLIFAPPAIGGLFNCGGGALSIRPRERICTCPVGRRGLNCE
ncbi:hypothetical protein BGX38DRAFT_1208645 [Terfezia claveryi]|nr:hypothetical protein BGX38DRAFT_1208645 [Terfezia claveryi]